MSTLKVLAFPHPDLKQIAPPLVVEKATLDYTIKPLLEVLYGLDVWAVAGPEVGLKARVFVMDVSEQRNSPLCFVNPEMVEKQGEILSEEDSLSLPGVGIKVKRARQVTVAYQDEMGADQTHTFEGLPAVCIQQKMDQLDGIQPLDHLSKLKRDMLLKKIKKEGLPQACGHGCGHDHH